MSTRAVGQTKVALDVQNRVASTTLPTVPTLLILPTVVAQIGGIGYDSGTGIYTAPVTGVYDTVIQFNISAPANRTFYFYLEGDVGGGFIINRYSARAINVSAATDGQITIASTNFFQANTRFKLYFWASAAATMVTLDIPGTVAGTVTVPAARVMITGT